MSWLFCVLGVASTLSFLLLLSPLLRQVFNTEEKPTVIFAIDNSQSMAQSGDSSLTKQLLGRLDTLRQKLRAKEIEVDIQTLDLNASPEQMADIPLQLPATNLSAMLGNVQNNYENRNLDKVVLLTDGIYNQGLSPVFKNFGFPVFSIALGDTTPQRDLKLSAVLANKVAYLGNEFPIVAEIENVGYPGRTVSAYLSQNGRLIDKKTLTFQREGDVQTLTFYTNAKARGMQRYTVAVEVLENEFTDKNNARDVFVEVIDGQEKILVVAAAPHPDIKALRSAIEKNENYDFEFYIPGIGTLKEAKYDVVIFHQIPNTRGVGLELLTRFRDTPTWFILGSQSDLNSFNQVNKSIRVLGRGGRTDEVSPVYNPSFNKFTFEADKVRMIEKLPPLAVPFGEYRTTTGSQVLLSQRVGSIATDKPLLITNESEQVKTAVLMGEGLWQWRLEEYALADSHESFDELIAKIIQYLSTKEDKRRLRVYPVAAEFYDFEKVVFESEVYNQIYERVYGTKINLSITDEAGKTRTYSFTSAEGSTRFEISGLKKGVYSYVATANLPNGVERSTGQFTVKDLQLEALNTTADHNLLRQLAQKTGGQVFSHNDLEEMEKLLLSNRKPNLIHSTEEVREIIHQWWLFFVLLCLVSAEWALRKYHGSY
ncbi:MAG: VWA domain-containing protein [Microscillaceae bacterium]|nr:VWA domain-containing protein [Microscillaceae bacterium]